MITSEEAFRQFIQTEGWEVTRGFPDFFCFRNGDFILVEVKATLHEALAPHQLKVANALASMGVKCFRWSPDAEGLSPFDTIPGSNVQFPTPWEENFALILWEEERQHYWGDQWRSYLPNRKPPPPAA